MKKSFCFALLCALFLQTAGAASAPISHTPEVKIVVSPKRIWLVADEMPVKSLHVQIFNAAGKVVLDQTFSSKTADWSLDLAALPSGTYSIVAGQQAAVRFQK